jgi:hypothetical protein
MEHTFCHAMPSTLTPPFSSTIPTSSCCTLTEGRLDTNVQTGQFTTKQGFGFGHHLTKQPFLEAFALFPVQKIEGGHANEAAKGHANGHAKLRSKLDCPHLVLCGVGV